MNKNNNEQTDNVQNEINSTEQANVQQSKNNKKVNNNTKIIILFISIFIIVIFGIYGVFTYIENSKKSNTSTSEDELDSFVVYKYQNEINVSYLEYFNKNYGTEIITYNCTSRSCGYRHDKNNSYSNDSVYSDESLIYVYDGGKIYKYDASTDTSFHEIQLSKDIISLSSYSDEINDLIIYYNDEDYIVSESYGKTTREYTSEEITSLGFQYDYSSNDKYVLYFSPNLLRNGYIIIQERIKDSSDSYSDVALSVIYDYKNNKVVNTITDDNIKMYNNFFEIGDGSYYTNNLVNIYNELDYEFVSHLDNEVVYHLDDDYFYYNDGKSVKIYNKDGNIEKSTKEYKNVFILYQNYALVEDTDSKAKLIDVTSDEVLVDYDVKLSQLKVYGLDGTGYSMYDWDISYATAEVKTYTNESIIVFNIGIEINANWDYFEFVYDTEGGSYYYNEDKE